MAKLTRFSVNPYPAKVIYLNFHSHEVVSRYRDPQPHVSENYSYLFNMGPNIYQSWCLNSNFIPNIFQCYQRDTLTVFSLLTRPHIKYKTFGYHLYDVLLDQRRRSWADVVHMLYKCFVFAILQWQVFFIVDFLLFKHSLPIMYYIREQCEVYTNILWSYNLYKDASRSNVSMLL